MKVSAVKEVLTTWSSDVIDIWFGSGSFLDNLIKPIIKVACKNYIDKADDILTMFADKEGEINIDGVLDQYINDGIPKDGLVIDVSKFAGKNFITNQISPKLLERSDVHKLKDMLKHGSQINY